MRNTYKGPSIDTAHQVSAHLATWFQRIILFYKSTNQKQELSVTAMLVNRSGQNEQRL